MPRTRAYGGLNTPGSRAFIRRQAFNRRYNRRMRNNFSRSGWQRQTLLQVPIRNLPRYGSRSSSGYSRVRTSTLRRWRPRALSFSSLVNTGSLRGWRPRVYQRPPIATPSFASSRRSSVAEPIRPLSGPAYVDDYLYNDPNDRLHTSIELANAHDNSSVLSRAVSYARREMNRLSSHAAENVIDAAVASAARRLPVSPSISSAIASSVASFIKGETKFEPF